MRIVSYHPNGSRDVRAITDDSRLGLSIYWETVSKLAGFPGVVVLMFGEHLSVEAELSFVPRELARAYREG